MSACASETSTTEDYETEKPAFTLTHVCVLKLTAGVLIIQVCAI